ncbi:GNAT family N-acetyltransferase [Flavobacterium sp. LC2016-23]|uniref:GNAT family N-acetyltransferase n=1 Tax=Flavobacterium sp. LC2016-23 TaxID=2666330 RepID=UPI0012AF8DAD|nr:GNAT family N-acetyltransferase [Flavobacterium sp. LC2016-23]MRX40252.1 GNAT family N-acetyltransferase [Flavobacterium sp. LC2016-23]
MVDILQFKKEDQSQIRDFVLSIQNDEFKLGFTNSEQPDLLDIEKFYRNGNFWTARINSEIIGTIGLQNLDNSNGVLRKMFVRSDFRGTELKIAQMLFDTLLDFAASINLKMIWLDTPAIAVASHRFYEKNGFIQTDKLNLPDSYVFPDKNSKIYKLALK